MYQFHNPQNFHNSRGDRCPVHNADKSVVAQIWSWNSSPVRTAVYKRLYQIVSHLHLWLSDGHSFSSSVCSSGGTLHQHRSRNMEGWSRRQGMCNCALSIFSSCFESWFWSRLCQAMCCMLCAIRWMCLLLKDMLLLASPAWLNWSL